MSLRRLHAPSLPPNGGELTLGPDAARHARVLRLAPGDRVELFDGRGREAEATVEALEPMGLRVSAEAPREAAPGRPRVVLVQAMPKGAKLDDIVRACTELGVAEVHLVHGARSVARPDEARARKRLARLSKIAREASRQSERADVPRLHPPEALDAVVARAPRAAVRLAFAVGASGALAEALDGAAGEAWVAVGPEGGWDPAEEASLAAAGFASVGLGPGVLRVETAAPVAVALVTERLGGLRPAGASTDRRLR